MRGLKSPLFILKMLQEKAHKLLLEVLEENESLFLISFEVSSSKKIIVVVDGDQGVSVQDCMKISRHIEHNLDREEEDFSLEVSSAGVSEGLQHIRQYKKNINRKVKVVTTDNNILEGNLTSADDEKIKLQWKAREPKPIGKGKVTVEKQQTIPLSEIKEAKVKIIF